MSADNGYMIVQMRNANEFVKRVNERIKEGWIPQGGASYNSGDYMQALVRNPHIIGQLDQIAQDVHEINYKTPSQ